MKNIYLVWQYNHYAKNKSLSAVCRYIYLFFSLLLSLLYNNVGKQEFTGTKISNNMIVFSTMKINTIYIQYGFYNFPLNRLTYVKIVKMKRASSIYFRSIWNAETRTHIYMVYVYVCIENPWYGYPCGLIKKRWPFYYGTEWSFTWWWSWRSFFLFPFLSFSFLLRFLFILFYSFEENRF